MITIFSSIMFKQIFFSMYQTFWKKGKKRGKKQINWFFHNLKSDSLTIVSLFFCTDEIKGVLSRSVLSVVRVSRVSKESY